MSRSVAEKSRRERNTPEGGTDLVTLGEDQQESNRDCDEATYTLAGLEMNLLWQKELVSDVVLPGRW
jgi:hypothetical protein